MTNIYTLFCSMFSSNSLSFVICKVQGLPFIRNVWGNFCSYMLGFTMISSNALLLDSRDQQGNLWLPYNAVKLAAFTIFAGKTRGKTRLLQYVITAKNLFKTSIDALQVMLLNFKNVYHKIFVCRPWASRPCIRPTSSRHIGQVFCHNASECFLLTHIYVIMINICPQHHSLSFDLSFYGLVLLNLLWPYH